MQTPVRSPNNIPKYSESLLDCLYIFISIKIWLFVGLTFSDNGLLRKIDLTRLIHNQEAWDRSVVKGKKILLKSKQYGNMVGKPVRSATDFGKEIGSILTDNFDSKVINFQTRTYLKIASIAW